MSVFQERFKDRMTVVNKEDAHMYLQRNNSKEGGKRSQSKGNETPQQQQPPRYAPTNAVEVESDEDDVPVVPPPKKPQATKKTQPEDDVVPSDKRKQQLSPPQPVKLASRGEDDIAPIAQSKRLPASKAPQSPPTEDVPEASNNKKKPLPVMQQRGTEEEDARKAVGNNNNGTNRTTKQSYSNRNPAPQEDEPVKKQTKPPKSPMPEEVEPQKKLEPLKKKGPPAPPPPESSDEEVVEPPPRIQKPKQQKEQYSDDDDDESQRRPRRDVEEIPQRKPQKIIKQQAPPPQWEPGSDDEYSAQRNQPRSKPPQKWERDESEEEEDTAPPPRRQPQQKGRQQQQYDEDSEEEVESYAKKPSGKQQQQQRMEDSQYDDAPPRPKPQSSNNLQPGPRANSKPPLPGQKPTTNKELPMVQHGRRTGQPISSASSEGSGRVNSYPLSPHENRGTVTPEPPGFKPYTLSDYKRINQPVKLGGLGPCDSEEKQFARMLKQKTKDYGKSVLAINTATLDGAAPKPVEKKPTREYLIAQAKRERAKEFAQQVPKPVVKPKPVPQAPEDVLQKAKASKAGGGQDYLDDIMTYGTTEDIERQHKVDTMEQQHLKDQEAIAAIRRQLNLF
eukprot:PhF_6_TR6948/c1_g1_i2/m.10204